MPNDKSDHDMIVEIHNTLCGLNGNGGLLKAFEKHKADDAAFRKDYYEFKRRAIGIFCFVAGGGSLTAGIIKMMGG